MNASEVIKVTVLCQYDKLELCWDQHCSAISVDKVFLVNGQSEKITKLYDPISKLLPPTEQEISFIECSLLQGVSSCIFVSNWWFVFLRELDKPEKHSLVSSEFFV